MARIAKRPTAKRRIKKASKEVLDEELSGIEFSQTAKSPSKSRIAREKALVKDNQSIFTPSKTNSAFVLVPEDSDDEEVAENSEASSDSVSDTDEQPLRSYTVQPQPLTTYETRLPKSTSKWKPLPGLVFAELKTVLMNLLPDSLKVMSVSNQAIIHKLLMTPLFKRMQNVAMPPLIAAELDLAALENYNTNIENAYDSSLTQLDDVMRQSIIERNSLDSEVEYLAQFKRSMASWKADKMALLDKLKVRSGFPQNSAIPPPRSAAGPVVLDTRLEELLTRLDSKLDAIVDYTKAQRSVFATLDRLNHTL